MGLGFKKTVLSEKELMEICSIVFVTLAQNGEIDDVTITEHPSLFITWDKDWSGQSGTIVLHRGDLWRALVDIAKGDAQPSTRSSKWELVGRRGEQYPEWVQPIGSHDAYEVGDTVTHNNKRWISTLDVNQYEPGVSGWNEVE